MKVILDTNVFMSGVFFSGPPHAILEAWRRERIQIVISPDTLEEYQCVGKKLATDFPLVDIAPILELFSVKAMIIKAPPLSKPVCAHPADDKFLACAIAGKTKTIISGDKALRKVSGYCGIKVLSPREFVDKYLALQG
jgi:putative PIN family toxin of toxin-antitoxin system